MNFKRTSLADSQWAPITVADKVRAVISRVCQQTTVSDNDDLSRHHYLRGDKRAELITALEIAFSVELSESEATHIFTVGDLVSAIEKKVV